MRYCVAQARKVLEDWGGSCEHMTNVRGSQLTGIDADVEFVLTGLMTLLLSGKVTSVRWQANL